ncbi:MAG: hypothetical protein RH917_03410 [Lacipirellulaceae bacterium]
MQEISLALLVATLLFATNLPAQAGESSCGCEEPCCVDPCECCKAKAKVGKRATCVCDPDCYKCESETKKEEVEKHCYNVCAEPVCVPPWRWPWECRKDKCGKKCCDEGCCDADCDTCCGDTCCGGGCDGCSSCGCSSGFSLFGLKCGKVRCINVLEKEKYKCEECVTKWKAVKKGCCGCCGKGSGCGCASGCCDGCCEEPACGCDDACCEGGCCAATAKAADVVTASAEETVTEETEQAPKKATPKKESAVAKFSKWFHR